MCTLTCICLRTENRSGKTHVFEYRDCGVEWGGVGGMLTFLVLRTWYIAMLLRSLGLFTTLHVATLLRSLGSFTTLHVATLLRSLGSFTTLYVATLLRSLGSFTTLHAATLCWDLWDRLLRYMFYVESDEKVNSQQLECQKWPLDGAC